MQNLKPTLLKAEPHHCKWFPPPQYVFVHSLHMYSIYIANLWVMSCNRNNYEELGWVMQFCNLISYLPCTKTRVWGLLDSDSLNNGCIDQWGQAALAEGLRNVYNDYEIVHNSCITLYGLLYISDKNILICCIIYYCNTL